MGGVEFEFFSFFFSLSLEDFQIDDDAGPDDLNLIDIINLDDVDVECCFV